MDYNQSIIFIPSYQPENVLVCLAKALKEKGYEVLIVDDGSGNKYRSIFDEASLYSTVLHYENNHGKGYALKYGFKYIYEHYPSYKCVITADGDGQHHIIDIDRVSKLCSSLNKTIIGDRTFDVKIPLRSKVGNDLSKFTQSLATYRFLHDNQCGLRGFPMSLLPELINIKGNRYEYEMNVMNYLLNKEIPFKTIKVQTIYEEGNKSSHFRPIRDTILIQGVLFKNLLISIISFILQIVLSFVLYRFVFSNNGVYPIHFDIEISIIISFFSMLILSLIAGILIFQPKYPFKMIFRTTLYQIILLVGYLIGEIIFTRLLGINLALSYFISGVILILPLFSLIKGIGLVYDYQNS